jgi:hypothetical protein
MIFFEPSAPYSLSGMPKLVSRPKRPTVFWLRSLFVIASGAAFHAREQPTCES